MSDLKFFTLNNLRYSFLFLTFTLSVYSCKRGTAEISYKDSIPIIINVDSIKQKADISDYIEKVSIIDLKETSGNIVGDIYKVLKTENNYIVFDRFNSKRVVVFDNAGKFVAKPADVGRSLQDPLQINDIWSTPSDGLGIYDFSAKKVYLYDAKFKLINVMQSPYDRVFSSLINLSNGNYAGYKGFTPYNFQRDGESYKLAYLGKDLSVKDTYLPYDKKLNDALVSNTNTPLQYSAGKVVIVEEFSNSILNMDENGVEERFRISYSKKALPEDYIKSIITPNAKLFLSKQPDFKRIQTLFNGYYGFKGNWKETSKFVIIESFDPASKLFYSIYDKTSKKIVISAYSLVDQKSNTMLPPFSATDYSRNEFIAIYPGYVLKAVVATQSELFHQISANLEDNYIFNVKFK